METEERPKAFRRKKSMTTILKEGTTELKHNHKMIYTVAYEA
jgi:hypothetical protein